MDDESLTVIGHDKTGKENIWGVTCMFSYSFTLVFTEIYWLHRILSKEYLGPYQTSTTELFCENSERVLAVNYSGRKAP